MFEWIGDLLDPLIDFIEFVKNLLVTLQDTINKINSIDFKGYSEVTNYLGYVRYVVGEPLWVMLWLVIAAPVGVYIWHIVLRGYHLIKELFS